MKYFTKEFYAQKYLMNAYSFVRKSKYAEIKDEEFYRKCFDNRYAYFMRAEKMRDWYIDPIKELKKVDAFVNEKNISSEERDAREQYREAFLYANKERIDSGKVFKFDKELCKRKFEALQNNHIEIYKQLPPEILDKIADIRVFVLGYASAEVKNLLLPYCTKLRHTLSKVTKKAFEETDETETHLKNKIDFKEFQEVNILSIEEKGSDIYLKTDYKNLIIKNGVIIEGQCKPVYPYQRNKPNCPWSKILFTELHFAEGIFKLNFLVSNLDEIEKQELWYLSICCTDITEID